MNRLFLVRPSTEYEQQVMAYKDEMLQNGDSFDGCAGLDEVGSYTDWMDFENRLKKKGWVPSEVFLAVRAEDNKVVGVIDYRRPLTPFLLQYGGNIGYSILPSERQKGYATEMLALLLPICKEYGEEKVLLTCNKANQASKRAIIKNGSVLENEVCGEHGVIERYWIKL